MKISAKTAKFSIIMMLGPAMCSSGQPHSTLPLNEALGAGSFWAGLIDDVRIYSRAVTP